MAAGEPWAGIPAMQLRSVFLEKATEVLEQSLTDDRLHELAGNHLEEDSAETDQARNGDGGGETPPITRWEHVSHVSWLGMYDVSCHEQGVGQ